MHIHHRTILSLILALMLIPTSAHGQDRAVLAFEVKPAELLESDLIDVLQLKQQLQSGPKQWQPMYEASNLRGILTAPESMDAVKEAIQSDQPPLDFYIRFDFDQTAPVTQLKKAFATRSRVEEKDDYTEMRPRQGENMYLAFGDKWVVFSTDEYDVGEKNLKRVSAELKKWKPDSKALIQAAGDVKAARGFLNEFSSVIRKEAQPLVFLIPMFEQVDVLKISITPDENDMMRLHSVSENEETADKFRESIAGLISMGKFLINQSDQRDPISDMAFQILETMRPEQDGNEIELIVKRPEGFAENLKVVIESARTSARKVQRMNDVRQVALAMHNYASVFKRLPFIPGEQDTAGLSWRVRILPFIEENELYEMFEMQEAWDSATNKRLLELQPPVYGGSKDDSMVCWINSDVTSFESITDGVSNTIAFIVVPKRMNWSEPKDITSREAVNIFQALGDEEKLTAGYYDGSVRQIDSSMELGNFKAFLTPAGGEVVTR